LNERHLITAIHPGGGEQLVEAMLLDGPERAT
jgi:hypothetical protein